MNLYERYVDWASDKIAGSKLFQGFVDGMCVVVEKLVDLNDKVADATGVDLMEKHLEAQKRAEEYRKQNPGKALLKDIGKAALFHGVLGVGSDIYRLKKD